MTESRTFSPLTIGLIIAVGVFAFAAFAVLSAFAPELRRGNDGRPHALSKSAVGFAGLVRLLEAQDTPVLINRRERGPGTVGLLVLTPTLETNADDVRAMIDRADSPVLVVLPKWSAEPHPLRPGWVRRREPLFAPALNGWLADLLGERGFDRLRRVAGASTASLSTSRPGTAVTAAGRVDELQNLLPGSERLEPLLSTGGGAVLARVVAESDREVFLLTDPDFLNTHGLAELDGARAATAILEDVRTGEGPVAFDVALLGFGQGRSLLKLAFAPPFLAATLCAAAAAGLAGWQAAVRFGPRARSRRAFAAGKQGLADNAAALIKLSGREHRMARRYADMTRARAAHAVAAPAGDEAAVVGYLDALPRASADAPRLSALLAEARSADTRSRLVAVARRLHHWRREVAREQ